MTDDGERPYAESILRKLIAVHNVFVSDTPHGPRVATHGGDIKCDAGEIEYLRDLEREP